MYQFILFDLDGTLTDSATGIIRSVNYALEKMGAEVNDDIPMTRFIGPPLKLSFQNLCGMAPDTAQKGVDIFRERYNTIGMFENQVYDGIREVLKKLKEAGKTLALATAKPEQTAIQIIRHFELDQYFSVMAGASLDESRFQKAEVIAYAMSQLPGATAENTIMVGDRDQDAMGARENGLTCLGALYGYGSREELTQAGATLFAEKPEDLYSILIQA